MGGGHSHEVVYEYVQDPALVQQLEQIQQQNAYLLHEYEKLRQAISAREIHSFNDLQRHDQKGAKELIRLASQTVPLQLDGGRSFGFFGLTSTGKSTMINKLLGSDLAKTGAGETTRQITSYDGSGYRLYDIPGRNDDISYFSMEYVAFWKALTNRLVLITTTVKEMAKVFRLLDAINLRYDIVVNKFDLVAVNERDTFKQQVQNQICECGLRGVNHVWYISAQNPRQFPDWMMMVNSLTIPFNETRSTTYVDGYHIITPSSTKRKEILPKHKNGELPSRSNLNEVHSLGGRLSIDAARQKQFEQYASKTFASQAVSIENQNQMIPVENEFLSPWEREATNWTDYEREQNSRAEPIEHEFIANSVASDQAIDYFAVVYEHLFAIDSWTDEQKSSLLQLMNEWESKFKQSSPKIFKTNMHHLSNLFTDPNGIVMNLPADTVLALIQSTDIQPECWFEYLLATFLEAEDHI
ncbi:unnamed protein product [Rotaria magnacalcarata]|uniref:G domain-containing protein n=1 Tax=Rotaria magnacalcarata TaxID=392030 RepID=A0A8S2JKR2_9BILA|nr:unnamed protein product [Rotaria magnacalcarata]CAF3829815.1 unnamed protein product [Rotaria magnacalcarata]CAF3838202.1 unnamed protein product [Rotaria magnacalcarata]